MAAECVEHWDIMQMVALNCLILYLPGFAWCLMLARSLSYVPLASAALSLMFRTVSSPSLPPRSAHLHMFSFQFHHMFACDLVSGLPRSDLGGFGSGCWELHPAVLHTRNTHPLLKAFGTKALQENDLFGLAC